MLIRLLLGTQSRIVFGALAVLLAAAFVRPQSVAAQDGSWSLPLTLGEYWFPDVAVDGSGRVHAVWSSGGDGYDTVMYASNTDGIWSPSVDIFASAQIAGGSEASRPTLMVDQANNLHATFRDTSVYYSQTPAGGAGVPSYWRPPEAIGEGYFSRVAVDSKGTLHLVYTQNVSSDTCRICYHVFYVQSADDGFTWSDPVDISVQLTGAAKPQLIVDNEDNLHVVWESGYGGSYGQLSDPTSVFYTGSYDGGVTWSRPYEFDATRGRSTAAMARNITIAQDGNGHLIVAWWAVPEDIVYYQLSMDSGKSWSTPTQVPGVFGIWALYPSRLDDYATAVDSAGRVHLLMAGRRTAEQTRSELLHLVWNGTEWSAPSVVASYAGDMPEWPRIAVGLGNQLHAVWFVRDAENIFNSDAGRYEVWYATKTVNSPPIPPVDVPAIPPPAPPAETVADQLVVPTPASQLLDVAVDNTLAPADEILVPNLRSENDDVLLVAMSLSPILLILVVAAVGLRVWRRRAR